MIYLILIQYFTVPTGLRAALTACVFELLHVCYAINIYRYKLYYFNIRYCSTSYSILVLPLCSINKKMSRAGILTAGAAVLGAAALLYARSPKNVDEVEKKRKKEKVLPNKTKVQRDKTTTVLTPSRTLSYTNTGELARELDVVLTPSSQPASIELASTSATSATPIPTPPTPTPTPAITLTPTLTPVSKSTTTPTLQNKQKISSEPVILAPEVIAAFFIGFLVIYKVTGIIQPSQEEVQAHAIGIAVAFFCLWCSDVFIKKIGFLANWKILHMLANAGVVCFALEDVIFAFTEPHLTCEVAASPIPSYIIGALHLYHLVAYSTSRADWFHHVLFCGTLVPVGLIAPNPIVNVFAFFLSGLPGGIDYAMLTLVKHKKMSPLKEKVWNARINVWLRSPGCMAAAAVMFVAIRYGKESTICSQNPAIGAVLGALIIFNGQYYSQVVVGNTFRKVEQYNC